MNLLALNSLRLRCRLPNAELICDELNKTEFDGVVVVDVSYSYKLMNFTPFYSSGDRTRGKLATVVQNWSVEFCLGCVLPPREFRVLASDLAELLQSPGLAVTAVTDGHRWWSFIIPQRVSLRVHTFDDEPISMDELRSLFVVNMYLEQLTRKDLNGGVIEAPVEDYSPIHVNPFTNVKPPKSF